MIKCVIVFYSLSINCIAQILAYMYITTYMYAVHSGICLQTMHIYAHNHFYFAHTQVNTFQCVLATNEFESFAIFLYEDVQWTTGDSSGGDDGLGGNEAVAGITAGDGVNFVTIPGSLTPDIINIDNTSNVGVPGAWIFKTGAGMYVHIYEHNVCDFVYNGAFVQLYHMHSYCTHTYTILFSH